MKKNNNEELEKCHCTDECNCGGDCHCEDTCDCGCCQDEFIPLEEKLILVGKEEDNDTKESIKFLNKKKVDYTFYDILKNADDKLLEQVKNEVHIPSLVFIQTIGTNLASGFDEIKDFFEE